MFVPVPFALLFKHIARQVWRHKTLTLLNVVGTLLGVAVFVAVQLANRSALNSFRASVDLVAGRSDFQIASDDLRFPETVLSAVWEESGLAAATPVVEQVAVIVGHPGEYLHVLGVDVFSNGPFRTWQLKTPERKTADPATFFSDPRALAVTRTLADRLGWKTGDTVTLRANGHEEAFRIVFHLEPDADAVGVDEHLAVMDIANAQEAFGLTGLLNRVDARLAPGADEAAVVARLKEKLPANVTAQRPERRGRQIETMIGAFQLNLTALSLIALVVGMFLVYNTVSTAVVRRRFEIGMLRALGLTRGQVQTLFLTEAVLLGLAGVIPGIALGAALAGGLIGAVSKTISSLYILTSIRGVLLDVPTLLAAGAMGLGSVVLAAWFPAREAARMDPVAALSAGTLEEHSLRNTGIWLACGGALLALAAGCGWWSRSGGPAWLSFGSALFVLMGMSFAVPWVSLQMGRAVLAALVRWWPGHIVGRLAVEHFTHSLHRNSVTIAALASALAMLCGISIMIHSFRRTVDEWLARSVTADVFVAPASNLIANCLETLPDRVVSAVRADPAARASDTYRQITPVILGRRVRLAATEFDTMAANNPLPVLGRDPREAVRAARDNGGVLISEPLSKKLGLRRGDRLPVDTPEGRREFPVEGVFTDYTSSEGIALMDRRTFVASWRDTAVNSVALYLAPGTDAEAVKRGLQRQLAPDGEYLVYSNRDLRVQVFQIFDQTFAVTGVLRWIAMLVSGIGIVLSLTVLVLERKRELGILRAVGATRAQVRRLVRHEALLIGVVGGGLGLVSGFLLAAVLTYVINEAFFGWTIGWATPWSFLAWVPVSVLVMCLAAAWLPSRRAAALDIADAVRAG